VEILREEFGRGNDFCTRADFALGLQDGDFSATGELGALNRACLSQGKSWLHLRLTLDVEGWLGPLHCPGGACFECLSLRIKSNLKAGRDCVVVRQQTEQGRVAARRLEFSPLRRQLAAMAALEVVKQLTRPPGVSGVWTLAARPPLSVGRRRGEAGANPGAARRGRAAVKLRDSEPLELVIKAFVEAVQGAPYVRHLVASDPAWRPAPDFHNVEGFGHTARLYTVEPSLTSHLFSVAQRVRAEVRLEELPRWDSPRPTAAIESLVSRLAARSYEVDLTTPDIASLGLRVVKVLIPELQPLHGVRRYPFLGGKRLYEVPVAMGYRSTAPTEAELNPYPHPFP
jgi:YcaO cyclodehydratase, ATP-ad Mg2+-binding